MICYSNHPLIARSKVSIYSSGSLARGSEVGFVNCFCLASLDSLGSLAEVLKLVCKLSLFDTVISGQNVNIY